MAARYFTKTSNHLLSKQYLLNVSFLAVKYVFRNKKGVIFTDSLYQYYIPIFVTCQMETNSFSYCTLYQSRVTTPKATTSQSSHHMKPVHLALGLASCEGTANHLCLIIDRFLHIVYPFSRQ